MSEAWYTFMDVDFPWKMKHSTIPCGFACTTVIPILTSWPIPNYLYIFIFKGEDLAWGMLHVAGRRLPLKDGALYYTLRFPLYHRHSPAYYVTYA